MKTLLKRNEIWNNAVQNYSATTISRFKDCISSSTPPPSQKVSLSRLNRNCNEVIAVDHFYLDTMRLIPFLDTVSRWYACDTCTTANVTEAIFGFQSCGPKNFWHPQEIHGDQPFNTKDFKIFISKQGVELSPATPRRQSKYPLQPKNRVLRKIFIRFKSTHKHVSPQLLNIIAVQISNELYGTDKMKSFELAKGFTKPV